MPPFRSKAGWQVWLPVAFQTVEEVLRTGHHQRPVEYRASHKNGGEVLVETQSSLIYHDGRPFAIQAIARNITERKAAEAHIRQQAALLEASHDAILKRI